MKTTVLSLIAGLAVLAAGHAAEVGEKSLVLKYRQGLAILGDVPVSYFSGGKPMKGDKKIEATFNGALYHFVSPGHVIGAIGVSGAKSAQQDEEVAKAGAAVFEKKVAAR